MRRFPIALRPARAAAAAVALLCLAVPRAEAQYSPLWTAHFGADPGTSAMYIQGRELASDGHLWIAAGVLRKYPDEPWFESRSVALLRLDPTGHLTWAQNLFDFTPITPIRCALRVDGDGYAYVAIQRNASRTLYRYAPNGFVLWRRLLDLDWVSLDSIPMTLDREGGLIVSGSTATVVSANKDLQLARYDSDGTLRWQTSHSGPLQGFDAPRHVAVDLEGRVHLTAVSTKSVDDPGTVVLSLAFDGAGRLLWTSELAANPDEVYYVHAAEVQADGTRTVAVGVHDPDAYWWSQTAFLLDRVGPDGEKLWTHVEPNQPLNSRECTELRTAPWGDLIVAGARVKHSSPTTFHVNLTGLAEAYSPSGEKRWSQTAMTKCKDTRFEDVLILGPQERVGFVTYQGSEPNCFPLISMSLEFFSAEGAPLDAQRIELQGAGHSVMPTGLVDAEGDLRLLGSANLPGNTSILVASRYTLAGRWEAR